MEVGPSMAPMMPMLAAWFMSNFSSSASSSVPKMPNCPAAPSSTMRGFSSSGPKSVMAPMPTKMSSGNNSVSTPAFIRMPKRPLSSSMPVPGMLARMQPAPIGSSSIGS